MDAGKDIVTAQHVMDTIVQLKGRKYPASHLVAKRLNISVRTLSRHLKLQGTTFQTLKNQIVFDRALSLLTNTDMLIQQVAVDVGFNDHSIFSHEFKKHFETSPMAYRYLSQKEHRQRLLEIRPDLYRKMECVLEADPEMEDCCPEMG